MLHSEFQKETGRVSFIIVTFELEMMYPCGERRAESKGLRHRQSKPCSEAEPEKGQKEEQGSPHPSRKKRARPQQVIFMHPNPMTGLGWRL